MNLDFTGDYKTKLKAYVDYVLQTAAQTDRSTRMNLIEDLTDEYVRQTGERPDPTELERLAHAILHEELSDPRPDKMTIEEYPIMSERMHRVRTQGAERKRNSAGVVTYEVPIDHASNTGTDGIDYSPAKRTFNNPW